jgi:hypothetical protein
MKNNELALDPEVRRMALAGARAMVEALEGTPSQSVGEMAPWPVRKRRNLSAAGRANIALAQRIRWARVRAEQAASARRTKKGA